MKSMLPSQSRIHALSETGYEQDAVVDLLPVKAFLQSVLQLKVAHFEGRGKLHDTFSRISILQMEMNTRRWSMSTV